MKRASILFLLMVLTVILGTISFNAAKIPAASPDVPSPTPTPVNVFTIELAATETPQILLTPPPKPTQNLNFVVKEFKIPRDLEVMCHKILWYSPIKTDEVNPNKYKFGLLWAIANEFQSDLVVRPSGEILKYNELTQQEKNDYTYTWLFERDSTFRGIMMRPGDHDWFRTCESSNVAWHESAANDNIIHIWYNIWMSEKEGLNSGRTVPREYIYYAFTPDHNGVNRELSLYKTKEDMINGVNAFDWSVIGVMDK